jgi:beta-phosphoglucomutase family hydrolase
MKCLAKKHFSVSECYFRSKFLKMSIKVHPDAKALIFDLDGTLSDSLPVHLATWNVVGDNYGFVFDPQIIHEMTGRPTIEFAQRIVEQYGLEADPHELVRMKQQSFWSKAHLLRPIVEVVSVVKENYGKLPMSVGTGAGRKSAMVQLETLDLLRYFDAVVTAEDVTSHKPQPETFLECARLMGVEPQYCQVFEDGKLGIEAAQKAGMMVTDITKYIIYGEWALL